MTDCLRQVANISCFAPPPPILNGHIGDDSITETDHILVEDMVAVLLPCEGIPFLGVAQVNSIKINKNPPSNSMLQNGRESDWMWNHGYDASVTVSGKILQQITLDLIKIEENSQKIMVGYGFHSNELQELAIMMFGMLSPEDVRKMAEIRCMDNFPYWLDGEFHIC